MSQIASDLEKLLALTAVDVALDDLERREAAAHERAAATKAASEAFRVKVKEERRELDDALKERKFVELDIKQREEQVKKYTGQMYEVKTNKEYTALKDEIERARGENQKLEDRLLQLMIREDELRGAAGRRAEELAAVEGQGKQVEAEATLEQANIEEERTRRKAERAERLEALTPQLLRLYERIRRARGGSPLARVVEAPGGGEGACAECHMTIRPQVIVEIHKQEQLIACESCGRILYLEAHQAAPAA